MLRARFVGDTPGSIRYHRQTMGARASRLRLDDALDANRLRGSDVALRFGMIRRSFERRENSMHRTGMTFVRVLGLLVLGLLPALAARPALADEVARDGESPPQACGKAQELTQQLLSERARQVELDDYGTSPHVKQRRTPTCCTVISPSRSSPARRAPIWPART